jgi:hypothetical protein
MRQIKERPQCRKAIISLGLQPHLANGIWDGLSYIAPDGHYSIGMSEGMERQMRKMVQEGYWGPIKRAPQGS